ncbi:MAG: peptidoglycan-binding protein [Casimicrobiaceae bacterium]|nr:peptidoglycan-binding protein [Casimicrobiaceae bacterium]
MLCETNATPAKIREIERAPRDAGFYRGAIDGRITRELMEAVTRFQSERKLPVDDGRVINLETLKALNISPF